MIQSVYELQRSIVIRELSVLTSGYDSFDEGKVMPFRILWLLIIRQAIFDYVKWKNSTNINNRRDAEDARRWLFEESDLLNSMKVACQVTGVDKQTIRNTAMKLTPQDIRKMEFQDRERLIKGGLEGLLRGNCQ